MVCGGRCIEPVGFDCGFAGLGGYCMGDFAWSLFIVFRVLHPV